MTSSTSHYAGEAIALAAGDARVAASYLAPTGAPPPGPRVGVLVLDREGAHGLHRRVAERVAAAGHPVLAADFPAGPSSTSAHESAVASALEELRRRASPERLVLFAATDAAHLAARSGRVDGLVLVSPRLFPETRPDDLEVFGALHDWVGSLLVLGVGDTRVQGPAAHMLAAGAASWAQANPDRHLEMGMADGPRAMLPVDADHALTPGAYRGIVGDFTLQWLERRFGAGYPRAWDGAPPTTTPVAPARDDSPEAQVPMLTTGAFLAPVVDSAPVGQPSAWQLYLPEGRAFALTEPLRQLVALVDGHRTVGEIAATLSERLGRAVPVAQVSTLLNERLAPLGVLQPDARGEGGEDESGMTDILIRCYEPHDRLRELLDNLTRVTRSPYNVLLITGKRSAVLNQNVGLERARTRYAVFLDDDVLLTEGWLERLRETMERTGAGAVSARQRRMDGSLLSTAAAAGDGEVVEALSGGACFMFRTDLGLRFDETYVRSQWDDVDFMFQLFEQGYKAYVDGRVDFYHHNDPKVWRGQNLCHFVDKWLGKGLLRGWAMYSYPQGTAVMPCFGQDD
jgi:hypothetical protein